MTQNNDCNKLDAYLTDDLSVDDVAGFESHLEACAECRDAIDEQKWIDNLKTVEDERIRLAIITANNHYAGFGPGTVNIFGNMLGLPEATWKDGVEAQHQYAAHDSKQRTLSDFLDIS